MLRHEPVCVSPLPLHPFLEPKQEGEKGLKQTITLTCLLCSVMVLDPVNEGSWSCPLDLSELVQRPHQGQTLPSATPLSLSQVWPIALLGYSPHWTRFKLTANSRSSKYPYPTTHLYSLVSQSIQTVSEGHGLRRPINNRHLSLTVPEPKTSKIQVLEDVTSCKDWFLAVGMDTTLLLPCVVEGTSELLQTSFLKALIPFIKAQLS